VSRTLTPAMTGHLATRSHTRVMMLLLVLRDGTSIGITDHDRDLEFDLGDGSVTYQAGTGVLTSDVSQQEGLDADNYEVTGPLKDGGDFTLERVSGGRFNRARAYLFQVNWRNLAAGAIKLLAGNVSEVRIEGGQFAFEIRSDCDRFNQVIGRLIVNNCDADYGDTRCGATPETVEGTVTAVTDAMDFDVSYPGSYADEYFNFGTVEFLTGDLAGTAPVEIHSWQETGVILLFTPLVEAPAVGDTLTIKRGCGKSRADCMARSNIENFRGFPEVPGSDQVFRPTIPGQS
jgi:uncharacterized phage protein (TIGR02218 family)